MAEPFIAEVKMAYASNGVFGDDFDPLAFAQEY